MKVMASVPYNELEDAKGKTEHTGDTNRLDPLYKYDTHYPERITKLSIHHEVTSSASSASPRQRRMRNRAARNSGRFRTQPITFEEIKEVDEDKETETKENLCSQFTEFSKSLDGLVSKKDEVGSSAGPVQSEERLRGSVLTENNAQKPHPPVALTTSLPDYDRRRQKKRSRKKQLLEEPEPEASSPVQERLRHHMTAT